jgi:GAF domain-containing protein
MSLQEVCSASSLVVDHADSCFTFGVTTVLCRQHARRTVGYRLKLHERADRVGGARTDAGGHSKSLLDPVQTPRSFDLKLLSAPVIARNQEVGVINVHHRQPHAHTGGEMEMLSTVGEQVGCLLVLAQLGPQQFGQTNHAGFVLSSCGGSSR